MIHIKTLNKLPDMCANCPCCAPTDGHCQADPIYRISEYRPFWCPLDEENPDRTKIELIATISKCKPYNILSIFNSKEEAIRDQVASTACTEEEAEKNLIYLKQFEHRYMFAGKIDCMTGEFV